MQNKIEHRETSHSHIPMSGFKDNNLHAHQDECKNIFHSIIIFKYVFSYLSHANKLNS